MHLQHFVTLQKRKRYICCTNTLISPMPTFCNPKIHLQHCVPVHKRLCSPVALCILKKRHRFICNALLRFRPRLHAFTSLCYPSSQHQIYLLHFVPTQTRLRYICHTLLHFTRHFRWESRHERWMLPTIRREREAGGKGKKDQRGGIERRNRSRRRNGE